MRKLRLLLVAAAVLWIVGAAAMSSGGSSSNTGTDPLRNASGERRGLDRVPASGLGRARALIRRLRVAQAGSMEGYDRDLFGDGWTEGLDVLWGRNGCETRQDILRRDLIRETVDACRVLAGTLEDPYTGRRIAFTRGRATSRAVEVDHVVPLAYAYRMRLRVQDREEFANDPRNLLAVDGRENRRKSDDGPSEWMPPNEAIECAYVVRWAQVARVYRVAVTEQDRDKMLSECR